MQGETVHLNINDCENDTANQLIKILEDEKAAKLLAAQVHAPVTNSVLNVEVLPSEVPFDIPVEHLAIWVDPIGEYTISYSSTFQVLHTNYLLQYPFPRSLQNLFSPMVYID